MPNFKINNNPEPAKFEEKRFYVPGTTLHSDCPECGLTCEKAMDDYYLSYPPVNEPFDYGFYCQNSDCQHEWKEKIVLRITLETPDQETLLKDAESLLARWEDDIRNYTNHGNFNAADFQKELIKELIQVVEKYRENK